MRNTVHLVTYVDRLGGGGIAQLHKVLRGPLQGLFEGVHLLPFFDPIDGADAGFDPIDHSQVDARLGSWEDVRDLAVEVQVMADLIVNHISSRSPQFRQFLTEGPGSRHRGLFLTAERVFPQGPSEADLKAIYRPRPGAPFTRYVFENGEERLLWTTFTPDQIDIDVLDPQGKEYLDNILATFARNRIESVRMDAIGYAIKRAGTSCFLLPETIDFITAMAERAHALGIDTLVEVHTFYRRQVELASRVSWVYDFALPPLVLHAFAFRTAKYLTDWIRIRPTNAVTVLDTHDGIGILDIGPDRTEERTPGLVPSDELDRLVDWIHSNSKGQSRRATGAAASNLDLYQVNCTFYDAMGRDNCSYLLARAVQFFLPGVPQVYYVGLLAGENDMALLAKTGVGRDINRHHFSIEEVAQAIEKPVVKDLMKLIRLRNSHPAFAGDFRLESASDQMLSLRWDLGLHFAHLQVWFDGCRYQLEYSEDEAVEKLVFASALQARGA